MKLIRRKAGKRPKTLGETYQNCYGFEYGSHTVSIHFTEETGHKDLFFEVTMEPAEALKLASWAIARMKGVVK